jgi:hypothetical protein
VGPERHRGPPVSLSLSLSSPRVRGDFSPNQRRAPPLLHRSLAAGAIPALRCYASPGRARPDRLTALAGRAHHFGAHDARFCATDDCFRAALLPPPTGRYSCDAWDEVLANKAIATAARCVHHLGAELSPYAA